MKYNIVYVEDDQELRECMADIAHKDELSYLGLSCLQDLERVLHNFEACEAEVFIVDSDFPETADGEAEFLAPQAINVIRGKYPEAEIILYSSEESHKGTAAEIKVGYRNKLKKVVVPLVKELEAQHSW